jgi:hypothetical protein
MNAPEVQLVTPELAAEWLATKNGHNRPIRVSRVQQLAADMRNSNWHWTGDTIKFETDDGDMVDGQHRLAAVVESGVSLPFIIVRDLDRAAQNVVDIGARRSPADVLYLNGAVNVNVAAAVSRMLIRWTRGQRGVDVLRGSAAGGGRGVRWDSKPVTIPEIVAYYLENSEEIQEGIREGSRLRTAGADAIGMSLLVFAWIVLTRIDRDDAEKFLAEVADGQLLQAGDPAYAFRKWLFGSAGKLGANAARADLLSRLFRAWNAFRSNEELHLVKSFSRTFVEPR